jgi:ABC-2 type transport system ATP-binding protein
MVEVEKLTKRYGEVAAAREVSFEVKKGEILALLGPNGAGKTTTVRMLACSLLPTCGKATVLGYDITKQPIKIKRHIGVLPEHFSVYERLNAYENLFFFAQLYDIAEREAQYRIKQLLERMNLADDALKPAANYSRGMKKKLAWCRCLLHRPELLFLDEPTANLDPKAAKELRNYVKETVKNQGVTAVICTHNLYEAESLCDKIVVINKGTVIAKGTSHDIVNHTKPEYEVKVVFREIPESMATFEQIPWIGRIERNDKSNRFTIQLKVKDNFQDLVNVIHQNKGNVESFGDPVNTLERAYMKLIENS